MWVTGEYFDALRDAANAARGRLDAEAQPSPFDRIDWFDRVWAHDRPGERPLIVRSRIGQAEAWLFLARTRPDRLTALANRHTLRFAPIFNHADDPATRLQLMAATAKRLRGFGMRRIAVPAMLADDAALMQQGFTRAGWTVRTRAAPPDAVLTVAGPGFDDYWDSRPDRVHEQVAAGSRHLHVEIADLLTPRLWQELELIGDTDAFVRALAEDASVAGTLRLGIVRVGDAPVGAQLWTVEGMRAVCHWRAEDEAAASYHPSAQLTASVLRYLINLDHIVSAEFGPHPDFADWASDLRPMAGLDLSCRRMPRRFPIGLVRRTRLD